MKPFLICLLSLSCLPFASAQKVVEPVIFEEQKGDETAYYSIELSKEEAKNLEDCIERELVEENGSKGAESLLRDCLSEKFSSKERLDGISENDVLGTRNDPSAQHSFYFFNSFYYWSWSFYYSPVWSYRFFYPSVWGW